MASSFTSGGGGMETTIFFEGKPYSIGMTWKYLEFLLHKLPRHFICIHDILRSSKRDVATLELALSKVEANSKVHRSSIFEEVSSACAKQRMSLQQTSQPDVRNANPQPGTQALRPHQQAVAGGIGRPHGNLTSNSSSEAGNFTRTDLHSAAHQGSLNSAFIRSLSPGVANVGSARQFAPGALFSGGGRPPNSDAARSIQGAPSVPSPPSASPSFVHNQQQPFRRPPSSQINTPHIQSFSQQSEVRLSNPNLGGYPSPVVTTRNVSSQSTTNSLPSTNSQYQRVRSALTSPESLGAAPTSAFSKHDMMQRLPTSAPHAIHNISPQPPQYRQSTSTDNQTRRLAGPPGNAGLQLSAHNSPNAISNASPSMFHFHSASPESMPRQQKQNESLNAERNQMGRVNAQSMNSTQQAQLHNLTQLNQQRTQLGATSNAQQFRFDPQALMLMSRKLRELRGRRDMKPPKQENECSEILLKFLASFIGRLWVAAVKASFKRVDCPAQPFENMIVDDISWQAEIERVKSYQQSEINKYQQSEHTKVVIEDTAPKPEKEKASKKKDSKLSSLAADELNPDGMMDEKPEKQSRPEPSENSSIAALKDFGLEDSLFGGLDDETSMQKDELSSQKSGTENTTVESATDIKKAMIAAAEAKSQEANAVRRKQAKLTREVTVDDIVFVLETQQKEFPMPVALRNEIIRFLKTAYVPPVSSLVQSVHQNESSLLAWRSSQNVYVPKQLNQNLSAFVAEGAAPVAFPGCGDPRPTRMKKRFINVWEDQLFSGRKQRKKEDEVLKESGPVTEKTKSKRKRPVVSALSPSFGLGAEDYPTGQDARSQAMMQILSSPNLMMERNIGGMPFGGINAQGFAGRPQSGYMAMGPMSHPGMGLYPGQLHPEQLAFSSMGPPMGLMSGMMPQRLPMGIGGSMGGAVIPGMQMQMGPPQMLRPPMNTSHISGRPMMAGIPPQMQPRPMLDLSAGARRVS